MWRWGCNPSSHHCSTQHSGWEPHRTVWRYALCHQGIPVEFPPAPPEDDKVTCYTPPWMAPLQVREKRGKSVTWLFVCQKHWTFLAKTCTIFSWPTLFENQGALLGICDRQGCPFKSCTFLVLHSTYFKKKEKKRPQSSLCVYSAQLFESLFLHEEKKHKCIVI